ncbi:hypothetical protein QBC34DRAFT_194303 [Podospora aff. communis PSN243]|uniref:Uncharacterized protein n=1 Tax=Podospora aff. communis PSN243 TaxID=3040156 RepID=A0AAV9H1L4_9PEZI|nr:hypothetical protein QBC34DRAFT_194303 [Podospora aff. communis PSN243]
MSTKEVKEPRESREPKESKEPRHRVEALRQPQRKDSLTSVLTYLQGRALPPKASSTVSSTSTQSAPVSLAQGLSKPRRHSHGTDAKKKARKNSAMLRTLSISNLVGIQEDSGAKTKHAKTPEGNSKTTKSGSSEKLNKTTRDGAEVRKKKSQHLGPTAQETKVPSPPPPMPKSILRVSSPDGTRPPPRHIRSLSTSAANPGPGQLTSITGLSPMSPEEPTFGSLPEGGSVSQPTSPVCRPLSPGATVRFAKATIHRVDVGPGRRFAPVKRRSKSTITYMALLDPVSQQNSPKVNLQSPTKLRRHQENQAAMGRYWLRTEEEEAQWRAEAERRAAEEAERYRAEPTRPPGTPAATTGSPESVATAEIKLQEVQGASLGERLAASDKLLPPLDSIPLLDKVESPAKSDADDKLETIEADDSDDSDAESDGGASTAFDDGEEDERIENAMGGSPTVEKVQMPVSQASVGSGAVDKIADRDEEKHKGMGEARGSEMGTEKPVAGNLAAEKTAAKPATMASNTIPGTTPTSLATAKTAAETAIQTPPAKSAEATASDHGTASSTALADKPKETQQVTAPAVLTTKPQLPKAETPLAQATQPTSTTASAGAAVEAIARPTQPAQVVKTPSTTTTAKTAAPTTTLPAAATKPITTGVVGTGAPLTPQPLRPAAAATALISGGASAKPKPQLTLSSSRTSSPARERPLSPRPMSPLSSSRPTSPLPTLRHKKSMASMTGMASVPTGGHLHLRRSRRYSIGDHKQEIAA